MRQIAADRQLLILDSRDHDADRCMFEKVKFIGKSPIECRGSATKIFTDPRQTEHRSDADPRQNIGKSPINLCFSNMHRSASRSCESETYSHRSAAVCLMADCLHCIVTIRPEINSKSNSVGEFVV